jgi:hypothetical protein
LKKQLHIDLDGVIADFISAMHSHPLREITTYDEHPLMKYDEEYGGDKKPLNMKIKFLSVGLNPSLTDTAKEQLDKILSQTSTNSVIELTDYQYKLKFVEPHQIQYFKLIDAFFTEISGKN